LEAPGEILSYLLRLYFIVRYFSERMRNHDGCSSKFEHLRWILSESVFDEAAKSFESVIAVETFSRRKVKIDIDWNSFNDQLCGDHAIEEMIRRVWKESGRKVEDECSELSAFIDQQIEKLIEGVKPRTKAFTPSLILQALAQALVGAVMPFDLALVGSPGLEYGDLPLNIYRYSVNELLEWKSDERSPLVEVKIRSAGKAFGMAIPQLASLFYTLGKICSYPIPLSGVASSKSLSVITTSACGSAELVARSLAAVHASASGNPESSEFAEKLRKLWLFMYDLASGKSPWFPLDAEVREDLAYCFTELARRALSAVGGILRHARIPEFEHLLPVGEHLLNSIIGVHIILSGVSNMFLVVPSTYVAIHEYGAAYEAGVGEGDETEGYSEEEQRRKECEASAPEIDYVVMGWRPIVEYGREPGARVVFEPLIVFVETTLGQDRKHEERVEHIDRCLCGRLRPHIPCGTLLARPCTDGKTAGKPGYRTACLEELMNPLTFSRAISRAFAEPSATGT